MSGIPRIAVVGGGPAGCAAVLGIDAKADIHLFEAGAPKRDKACGDALIPAAVALLRPFGLTEDNLEELEGHRFNSVLVKQRRAGESSDTLLNSNGGYVVKRALLDQYLRNAVGAFARVRYQKRVRSIDWAAGNWLLSAGMSRDCERYDAVIIAAGSVGAILAERLGLGGNAIRVAAVTTYTAESCSVPTFRYVDGLYGYTWSFPTGQSQANIGVCSLAKASSRQLAALAKVLGRAKKHGKFRASPPASLVGARAVCVCM